MLLKAPIPYFRSSQKVPVLIFHLLGESILATPAVSRIAMFFRTQNSLIAVGKYLPPEKK